MKVNKLSAYYRLIRLHRPIGIFLMLWPILVALWIAGEGRPDPVLVSIFVLGVVIMRSAGCVINDLADIKFDKFVTRTKMRPLTTGELKPIEAIALLGFLLFFAFILALTLNALAIKLSFIAVGLTIIYPFMKRYMDVPQVVLGLAFGLGVPMAFAEIQNVVPWQAWALYVTVICWTLVFDTEYAMVDREDDKKIGLKSTAILFGKADRLIIGVLQLIFLCLLSFLGHCFKLGSIYFVSLFGVALFSLYQQYLIKDRKPEGCFKAFMNNHWLGAWLFGGILLDYYLKNPSGLG